MQNQLYEYRLVVMISVLRFASICILTRMDKLYMFSPPSVLGVAPACAWHQVIASMRLQIVATVTIPRGP